MTAPRSAARASGGNDRTALWGVLGIVLGLFCWPLGIVFGVLSLNQARKAGKPPVLAYIAFAVAVLGVVISGLLATGNLPGFNT